MNEAKPWLRHYPSEVAPTYEYPKHNLARLLVDSAHKFPDRPALYFLGKTLSLSGGTWKRPIDLRML